VVLHPKFCWVHTAAVVTCARWLLVNGSSDGMHDLAIAATLWAEVQQLLLEVGLGERLYSILTLGALSLIVGAWDGSEHSLLCCATTAAVPCQVSCQVDTS
jgi:hypothetical protein